MGGIKIDIEKATDPLPSSLFKLKTYYDTSIWDESIKEQIVSNLLIVESECKTHEGRHLSKLSGAYNIVCGYLERLAELDVHQKTQLIKTFDSLLGGNLYILSVGNLLFLWCCSCGPPFLNY